MVEQVTPMRPKQKTTIGVVVSDKMDKTVIVAVEKPRRHRIYGKTLRRTERYKAHDPENVCRLGDRVRLVETRPISKEKRWRVVEILQHKEVAEVKPSVIGRELEVGRIEAQDDESQTETPTEAEAASPPTGADADEPGEEPTEAEAEG